VAIAAVSEVDHSNLISKTYIYSPHQITDFLNKTLASISTGITSDVQKANSAIKTLVDGINSIPFVPDVTAPQFTVPSADQLAKVQIPTDFENSLKTLNSTLPTLDDIRNKLDQVLGIPFNLLKKEINDTFINAQRSFVATPLPVPDGSNVTFCHQMDLTVIDDLSKDIAGLARTGLFILVGVILVLIIAYTAIQWYSQRSLLMTLHRARAQWFPNDTAYQPEKTAQRWEPTDEDLLIMHAYLEHPLWSRFIYALSGRFNWSRETTNALGWFGTYVFHRAAMVCLMIGLFGLLSVELQFLAARPLQAHYSAQVANAVNDFSNTIASNINATMAADSKRYAGDLNVRIDAAQSTINDDLFGWVNGTTTQLNATLAAFYEDVQDAVNKVFGNTPLGTPAQEFLRCILGNKITSIEHALTFLHDNLVIDIRRVPDDVLMLSQGSVNEVVKPISAAAVGSGNDSDNGGVVGKLVNAYIKALEKERTKFLIFLLLWLGVFLVACGVVIWHLWGQRVWWMAMRKRWERKARNFNGTQFYLFERRLILTQPFIGHHPSGRPASPGSMGGKATPDSLVSFTPLREKRTIWPLGRSQQEKPPQPRASNPAIPRSWDELLDERERQRGAANGGKFTTLMNIGRRATRIGKSLGPSLPTVNYRNGPPPPPPAENDDSASLWIKRMTFWKKSDVLEVPFGVTVPHSRNGSVVDGHDYGVAPPRKHHNKPRLTIDTQRASNALGLSAPVPVDHRHADSPKASAASTAPQPAPPMPVANPKKPVISPPRPLQPRKPTLPTKPNQHIPLKLDHRSLRSGDTLIPSPSASTGSAQLSKQSVPPKAPPLPSMSTTIMPIPLHHNFASSSAPAPSSVPASNLSPFRTPDAPRQERKHQRTPSAVRLLTPSRPEKQPQPARHSPITVDPFADNLPVSPYTPGANPFSTPFDDSNVVHTSKPQTARRSPPPPGLNPLYGSIPDTSGKAL
jgi:hypothetical protein